MYKKLLISAGGGIISKNQQAEQNVSATIAIGLGGTGVSCLRALKKEVYDRLKPDDDSPIPKYKHIQFLAIDTDATGLSDEGTVDSIDKATEFLDFSCPDIHALLKNATVLKNKPYLKWLKAQSTQADGNGIEIQSAQAGAGGVRQIGRLLLLQNCTNFCTKFENMLKSAIADLPASAEINIHIFTGLGGGTGAGTFLDVCYVIQHILSQMALDGRAQTCGYFFLPDVNLAKVADSKIQEYIKSNGFASMKELDYCMNFATNGGCWEEAYDGFTIKTVEPPVKLAHLITATDSNGAISSNGYDYAMHVAVDYVMDFLVKPAFDETTTTDNPFTMKSHISNIRNLINMVNKEHGATYDYCVLGASNAYLPYKEITTYLTSKIFEGFSRLDHQLPSENDIDLLVQNMGLKYEDITRTLNDKVPMIPLFAVDKNTIYEQTQGISSDTIPQVLTQMRDTLSKVSGKLTENKKAMLEDLDITNADANRTIASLITRVKKKQLEIAALSDKGPYYAGAILHNVNSKDLQNKIDGYIEQNNKNLSMARADMTLRDQSMADTLRNLQNSNFMNRKKYGEEYVQAVNSYYKQSAKIEMLSVLNDVLVEFKKQINDLYVQFYAVFETVMHNLESTFAANLSALANPVEEDKGYAVKLMTVKDMKDSLDASVKAMHIDDLISGFVTYMLNDNSVWIGQEESKIAYAVSNYFLGENVLNAYTNQTMIDYLKIKFNTEDSTMITSKVYGEIVQPLSQKAAPLFWLDGSKYQISSAGELGFCTVPQISPEIIAAANNYHAANNRVTVRPSYNSDRISFLMFRCGIPLYGYQGVDTYRGAKRVTGAQLHEGASEDNRDWRSLHDITPLSCIDVSTLSDSLKKKSETYDIAFEKGIVAHRVLDDAGTFDFVINKLNEGIYTSEINEINDALASGDLVKLKTTYEKYKDSSAPLEVSRSIKNFGSKGCEDLVAKDLIVSSQVLINMIAVELEKIQERSKVIASLEEKIGVIESKGSDVRQFAATLCTGVIVPENDYTYTYTKETFGVPEKTELTTIDAAPYGEYLPLYSAYVGFAALSAEVKKEIADAIKDKKVNHGDEVAVSKEKAKALIAQDRINAMVQRAQMSFATAFGDITSFLKALSSEINMF